MGILIVLLGGLLFLYLNIKCAFKINITFYFLHVYFYVIILRKKHEYQKRINFSAKKIIDRYKAPELRQKTKNNLKYLKHIKKVFNIFYVKDIFFYPECILEKQSFALEFVIVNRMLKKSLLNG
ncbi:MAG TPA: hypothetical protein PLA73_03205 [Sedimentibacter sp.]|jgi:hypothetical protein|nr:hypothetical protein [Sedimentibacter sp.]HOG62621.1 hypothetical protein [Sedimentibacter sp.]HQC69487.1 hypothetical protein [Sedimentibacter sp.]HQK53226.1 hypothetical protein [Sedimentibacter sp.]